MLAKVFFSIFDPAIDRVTFIAFSRLTRWTTLDTPVVVCLQLDMNVQALDERTGLQRTLPLYVIKTPNTHNRCLTV